MPELLPSVQAGAIRDSLTDYLTTTFALTDEDARRALAEFLGDPANGLFKGPYVRLRLPFRPAAEGWRDVLDWFPEGAPPPYGHQAAAYARLSSAALFGPERRPQPTLVTTGTGSGKTEAFLHPILDHALRAKRAGITGTKAIVLYPMNALANDQAGRLTKLLVNDPGLGGVTAALYTGEKGKLRTKVTADGLITDRAVIRSDPPDILLTNYKMLDQLLLRRADADLWAKSAHSLQYLVLDEFHTYDGAQGTDVAMLLRRLGLALKSHWAADDPQFTPDDWARPLGRITPVATSATLGDGGDPATMLEFAATVFGEPFPADAVVTETRLGVDEWIGDAPARVAADGYTPVNLAAATGVDWFGFADLGRTDGAALCRQVLGALYALDPAETDDLDADRALDLLKAHPLTPRLLEAAREAVPLRDLAVTLFADHADGAEEFLVALLAAFSHVRAKVGRAAANVDLHLWVRELTRIDRSVSAVPRYRWADDGEHADHADEPTADTGLALPALFCRHCGRSGWGVVLAPTGHDLDGADEQIRRRKLARDARYRPLLHAPTEGDAVIAEAAGQPEPRLVPGLRWLAVRERQLLPHPPSNTADFRGGSVLPVLTHTGDDAGDRSIDDTCPACGQKDAIRWLGSAIATLLSVTLSTLFGTENLDEREKKALVFTDSVQDAAHRAGFVQTRSYSLTLRAVLREAVGREPIDLQALVDQVIANAGDDRHRRYRIVPPDLADKEQFEPFWKRAKLREVPTGVRNRVKLRLLLDATLEFGLQSRTGRTLERTGSVAAEVAVGPAALLRAADQAIEEAGGLGTLDLIEGPDAARRTAWVRGVLERMRERGAIEHKWFHRYQQEDGARFSIWGGRPRAEGMPAFPAGRPAPGYPRVGGVNDKRSDLDPVTATQSWYALWTAKCLGLDPQNGSKLARLLFQRLAQADVITAVTSKSGAQIYQLPASSIVVAEVPLADLAGKRHELLCPTCQADTPASPTVVAQLDGAPCLVARCKGTLTPAARADNFYRRLYASADMRRVVAREHTSLLPDEDRRAYEDSFRSAHAEPQAPNVLVATPTLEMGIDIGDLSAVMLAGLPRSVASYLQRVGRAGRLTGNALCLSFVTGRGDQLPRLGDPLSVINGDVRPPATYLDAEEILRRQYIASIADVIARDPNGVHPATAKEAIGSTGEGSYLGSLIDLAETRSTELLDAFLGTFDGLADSARDRLREWATRPSGGPVGSSALAQRLHHASQRWATTVETLEHRRKAIHASLPDLQQRAEVLDSEGRPQKAPGASEEDVQAYRSAKAALRLTDSQLADLRGEYWIGVLEEHGLLPNYTLLGDGVELDVALSYVDPESGDYRTDSHRYRRGGAMALREFAPGATFYAGGSRIKVDAIELGHDAQAVRTWIHCAECGYARDLAIEGPVATCPRCASPGIADVNQRIDVVELEQVYSAMRRDDAAITDERDERDRGVYTIQVAADIDRDRITREWYVENYGFGAKHLRDLTIRWLNLGPAGARGPQRDIAGAVLAPALFRVCAACGQLDTGSGVNMPHEHRPWCPNRKLAEERVRTVALSRTLRTEGLVVRLPYSVTLGDTFALPSLSAALLLGLRERLGGAPDHLQLEVIVDPTAQNDAANPKALLLHDVVPGGTGYLAELAEPAAVWTILRRAWELLRDCACQHEERLACHRCLLPFAAPHLVRLTSRAAAERHLREILTADGEGEPPEAMSWTCTETAHVEQDPESWLEKRFRQVLLDRLKSMGATVREQPTSEGNKLTITLGGGRVWTLEPQQNMLGSKPDFVLRGQGVPDLVVFTDGWKYHASPSHPRVADDAIKRATLRDSGRVVLAVTAPDIETARTGTTPEPPPWWEPTMQGELMAMSSGALNSTSLSWALGNPIDLMLGWIQNPRPDDLSRLASWVPWFLAGRSRTGADLVVGGVVVEYDAFTAPAVRDVDNSWVWSQNTVALAATADGDPSAASVVLSLDDRTHQLGADGAKEAWREWLRLSNLLNLRTPPAHITTRTLLESGAEPATETTTTLTVTIPPPWKNLYDSATDAERDAILRMASDPRITVPEQGLETDDGIALGLAWPAQRVVSDAGMSEEDLADLEKHRWTVWRTDGDPPPRLSPDDDGKR
ncbi:DEAD/DEAH box helicase [Sporichthya brevicatena]|uniref:DEAD/DEAH box helicase n=1 Tax=Sporichthya brevicatena TaxID=171442 RepID=A0ABN1H4X4_9ACTN